ncbi:hypothetical protein FACS1894166_08010 [Bacilli bacterium]|nr:hypothetical protein FACS1894166_08010 [Bacilli bacterium]
MENKKTHSVAKIVASAAVAGVCTGVTTAILLQQNHDIDKENFSIGNNQNITAANDISILIPESTTIGNFQVEEYDEITEDMVKDRIND